MPVTDALAERRLLKDRVLEAALLHAAFDGWSRRTLIHAARDAGLDAAAARRLFPQGGDSLLAWLDEWADRRMLERATPDELARLPVRRRIATLVRARLELLSPHREAVRRAVAARSLPGNVAGTGRAVWRTVDRMWHAAGLGGAPSGGLSFYSRRGAGAGGVGAPPLHWLDDQSEEGAATWAFLDRRIEDVMQIGRMRTTLDQWLGWLTGRTAHAAPR